MQVISLYILNLQNMQNMQNNMQKKMQNMQAICRFADIAVCCRQHANMQRGICKICKACEPDSNMQDMHSPLC